jgi:hypothetical protein
VGVVTHDTVVKAAHTCVRLELAAASACGRQKRKSAVRGRRTG